MKSKKIFIATGNKDKFNRMKAWIKKKNIIINGIFDLPKDFQNKIAIPDKEEKRFKTMSERAIGKADYASNALKELGSFLILAMDDTAYFPLLDLTIIDLRNPPDIFDKNARRLMKSPKSRLEGIDLGNFYAELVDKTVLNKTEKMKKLGYKYMPIIWRFALAGFDMDSNQGSKLLCTWERMQYIRNQYLKEAVDNGYVMDNIISETPEGELSAVKKGRWVEKEPVRVLNSILK